MTEFLLSVFGIAFNTAAVAYVATRLLDVRYTLWRLVVVSVCGYGVMQYGLLPSSWSRSATASPLRTSCRGRSRCGASRS
nr:hypothetical protein GCM10025732_43530 [Glycomyces mayteni]